MHKESPTSTPYGGVSKTGSTAPFTFTLFSFTPRDFIHPLAGQPDFSISNPLNEPMLPDAKRSWVRQYMDANPRTSTSRVPCVSRPSYAQRLERVTVWVPLILSTLGKTLWQGKTLWLGKLYDRAKLYEPGKTLWWAKVYAKVAKILPDGPTLF